MPRSPSWTDQQLIDAVDVSTSYKQVCDRLGLWPGGGTYRTLERHMARLNLETTHLDRRRRRNSRRRWTDEEFAAAVRESKSFSEVARRLGYDTSGGIHRFVKLHITRLNLDTSHFTGQSWARGMRFPGRRRRPLAEILVERSTYGNGGNLRRRLIADGLKEARCELCGITEWRGQPVKLELDHINGDHTDRLENLRIVCPNCHALTETYCNSRSRRRSPTQRHSF
jgi:transposase-like protein